MEPKKNPKYDVHQKRGVLLNVGLIVSLILVISAFKWKVSVRPNDYISLETTNAEIFTYDDPRVTTFKKIEAPKPLPVKPVIPVLNNFTAVENAGRETDETLAPPDQGAEPPDFGLGRLDIPTEPIEPDTFRIVEKMPEPIGGWTAFYETLSKNIKYPKPASRMGVKGKVFVEFTINDKGQLSHFKILKGIGHGCDEEAKRILALTKWTPGKQRGKPVNVRLVQPIVFSLGEVR
ncbi:energy transducer TonB [Chryseolinea sp. H1M3-3]|uniref:energy transducer TonB n=1 Tax=Chryseolinea sp. H1M3-3 TaxID=3034144 RepID=UPI0023ED7070|nr:energy transducer TonB [Chryseolinea sp. H1M3-3]